MKELSFMLNYPESDMRSEEIGLKLKCKKSERVTLRTLTAQPERDRVQENVPAVVAAVVALRRVVSVKQDQTSVQRDSVPRQC